MSTPTLVVLLISSCESLRAQGCDTFAARDPRTSFKGLWRFDPAGNLAWRNPAFDDSPSIALQSCFGNGMAPYASASAAQSLKQEDDITVLTVRSVTA